MPPMRARRGRPRGPRRMPRREPRTVQGERQEWQGITPPPSPPPPPPPAGIPERRIEEVFLRQNPPVFNGMGDPSEAEVWIRALERIFDFLHCTDKERMTCVTFQLTGSADFWWEARRKVLTPDQLANMTWEQFKTSVYDKYIPKSYRKKKEMEFYNLKQGKMSATEYDRVFCEMSRYVPDQVDTEEKMAEKFRTGLRYEIRMALASHRGLTYPESLSRALDIEAAMPSEKPMANVVPPPSQAQPNPFKDKRKWEGNQNAQGLKKPWQTPNQAPGLGKPPTSYPVGGYQAKLPPCPKCNRIHTGICKAGTDTCFACGKTGHFARNCPNKPPEMGARPQLRAMHALEGNKQHPHRQPQRPSLPSQAKAYALSRNQSEKNKGNLAGMGKLLDIPIILLFDTGASHSFISALCVNTLKLPTKPAEPRIRVVSPIGGIVEIKYLCSNVELSFGNHKLIANNLSVMSMSDVDIILGMDWLAENHATILCNQRQISFQSPGKEPTSFHGISMGKRKSVISALQAPTLMRKGHPAYLVYLRKNEKLREKLKM